MPKAARQKQSHRSRAIKECMDRKSHNSTRIFNNEEWAWIEQREKELKLLDLLNNQPVS